MIPSDAEKERFRSLCALQTVSSEETEGIGRLAEKNVHRLLKCYYDGDFSHHEVPVGSYVADVLSEGEITEIQTGSLYPLRKKLIYYLDETEYSVEVVHPIYARRKIVRVDPETGEVLRRSRTVCDKPISLLLELSRLYGIWDHPRLTVTGVFLEATETRFSEAMRYRLAGKYDRTLTVEGISEVISFRTPADVLPYLTFPEGDFSMAEFGRANKVGGRDLWRFFRFLDDIGVIRSVNVPGKEGQAPTKKRVLYRRILFLPSEK